MKAAAKQQKIFEGNKKPGIIQLKKSDNILLFMTKRGDLGSRFSASLYQRQLRMESQEVDAKVV